MNFNINEDMKIVRELLNITQEELADELNVEPLTIKRIENGITNTTGGIVGKVWSNNTMIIKNCTNNDVVNGTAYFCGGLFGSVDAAEVSNCVNNGKVLSTSDCVGGIAAAYENAKFTDCHNYGAISGTTNVAGIVFTNKGIFTNCDNYGSITATNANPATGAIYVTNTCTIDSTCEDLKS